MLIAHYFTISYLLCSIIFAILDFSRFSWLRISTMSNKSLSINLYIKCIPNVVINLILSMVSTEYSYNLVKKNINLSYTYVIISLICYVIFADAWFYFFHRIFHSNKYLYKTIHAHHHYYVEPFAFSGIECHIIEHIFINICSVLFGPFICSFFGLLSLTSVRLWACLAGITTCVTHSGYNMFNRAHFDHHLYLTGNYGLYPYISDKIFKTYKTNNKA